MKTIKTMKTMKITLLFFLTALILFPSCKKAKIRKNIEGIWTFESLTVNAQNDSRDISGTYTFNKCSSKDNRKGNCTVNQDLTISVSGSTPETTRNILKYRVLKKGERILLDDTEYSVSIEDSKMTLTSDDGGATTIIKLNK